MAKRPSAKQLAARRAFAARFGGKKPKRKASRPRRSPMAKKSRAAPRRTAKRSLNTNSLLAGGLAGAVGGSVPNIGPVPGQVVADFGIGYVMGNETLQTIGARNLGAALRSGMGTPAASTGSGAVL